MIINDKPILVVSSPKWCFKINGALGDAFELKFVSTCKEAEDLLKKRHSTGFGMILASIDFDEPRLFELLKFVREMDSFDSLPFVVAQFSTDRPLGILAVTSALEGLKSVSFLKLQNFDEEQATKALLDTVLVSFLKQVKYQRVR